MINWIESRRNKQKITLWNNALKRIFELFTGDRENERERAEHECWTQLSLGNPQPTSRYQSNELKKLKKIHTRFIKSEVTQITDGIGSKKWLLLKEFDIYIYLVRN